MLMSNTRSPVVLLFLMTLTLPLGGCLLDQVAAIGRYDREYNVDEVAMTADGSILVVSHRYTDGGRITVEKTHYFLYSADFIAQQAQDTSNNVRNGPTYTLRTPGTTA